MGQQQFVVGQKRIVYQASTGACGETISFEKVAIAVHDVQARVLGRSGQHIASLMG